VKRFCFIMELKPGAEQEYVRRHREIWPEMLSALRDAGIRNYTLFRRDRMIIAYSECEPDGESAFRTMAQTEVNANWSEWFEDLIERRVSDDGLPLSVAEVWHLD
jgi:L-rhamnose mutarotase